MFDTDVMDNPALAHNPGGKVKTALPPTVHGDAVFSACGRYRHLLRRWIGDEFPARYWLLIGMNPSTADASANDPTVSREWGFTEREGYTGLIKCNVGDYRATNPDGLKTAHSTSVFGACSPDNLPAILRAAEGAERVVVCFGKVPLVLRERAQETVQALRSRGIALECFGANKDGSPKHPLYLRKDTPLIPYP